jgi:hypothetical protein
MTIITNTIHAPDGEAIPSALVEVQLLWDKNDQRIAKDDDAQVVLMGVYATYTNQDGEWSVSLTPNASVTPADTVYRVIERVPPGKTTYVYYIEVPVDTATPAPVWIGDILVDKPSYA